MFGSGEPKCVRGRWVFGSGKPKCVRGKTVIPWTNMFNIVGLSMYTWLKCYSLEMLSDCVNVIVYYGCINIFWLKCYLSGDALHGSGSRLNPIKRHLCCDLKPLSSLHMYTCTLVSFYYSAIAMVIVTMQQHVHFLNSQHKHSELYKT